VSCRSLHLITDRVTVLTGTLLPSADAASSQGVSALKVQYNALGPLRPDKQSCWHHQVRVRTRIRQIPQPGQPFLAWPDGIT